MIHVDDCRLHLDAVDVEELELHAGHRPGGVLRERLVDAKRDLATRSQLAALEVLFEDRAGEGGHQARLTATQ